MSFLMIFLICTSFAVLALGFWAWRLTSSRTLFLNTMFCSTALLIAAYYAGAQRHLEMTFLIPFLTAMLFGGRGGAFFWRSRKEPALWTPALLLLCVAGMAIVGAVTAFLRASAA